MAVFPAFLQCRGQAWVLPVISVSRRLPDTQRVLWNPFNLIKWLRLNPFLTLDHAPQFNVCQLVIFVMSTDPQNPVTFHYNSLKSPATAQLFLSFTQELPISHECLAKWSRPWKPWSPPGVHCSYHPSFSEGWLSLADAFEKRELYPVNVTRLDPSSDAGTCFEG